MLEFVNINLMIFLWTVDLDEYYSTPLKGVERVWLVQFLCCYWLKYWATAALNLSLSSISLMCRGMEFQSMTVLGINEYFRQFLFVAIWINWLCLDERRTGRRIVCVGMARQPHIGLDVKWRPCSLSFSPPMIPTPAPFFISVTAPTFIVACYETSTRVSKWSYQNLILTPNTWLSLTKEGVPTVFRRPLYFITIVSKFLTGAIFKCHPRGYPFFDAKKQINK